MARGGARPNSGPKRGSKQTKTRALALEAAAQGMSPVQVMLAIMRKAFEAGDDAVALESASKAAPFIHPRLSAVALDLSGATEDELRRLAQ